MKKPSGRRTSCVNHKWRRDYAAMQGDMLLGTPPAFDEILATITVFQSAFNEI